MVRVVITSLVTFGVTLLMVRLLMRLAPRLGLVDEPGDRRQHLSPTPLVGGLAMFIGMQFAVLVGEMTVGPMRALLAGAAVLVIVGVLDDMHELSSRARFAAQLAAAMLMVYWGGEVLNDLGALWSDSVVQLNRWSVPLTLFAVVGMINAFNMIDGLDGLAGSLLLLAFGALGVLALDAGMLNHALWILACVVIVSAFLVFNFPWGRSEVRVFMGDAGSMFLGFVLTWFCVNLSQGESRAMPPVAAIWLVAVPLIDTLSVMLRRVLRGKNPFSADREHAHHLLLALGATPRQTLLVMLLVASFGTGALFLARWSGTADQVLFYGFLAWFGAYFLLSEFLWRRLREVEGTADAKILFFRRGG